MLPLQYSNHCLTLLNDNYHTFDFVQRTMKKVLKDCSLSMGEEIANHINSDGRGIIHVGDFTVTRKKTC